MLESNPLSRDGLQLIQAMLVREGRPRPTLGTRATPARASTAGRRSPSARFGDSYVVESSEQVLQPELDPPGLSGPVDRAGGRP